MNDGQQPAAPQPHKNSNAHSPERPGAWPEIARNLENSIGKDAFDRWFGAAVWNGFSDGVGMLIVPSEIFQVWIETNYLPELILAAGKFHEGLHHVGINIATADPIPGAGDEGNPPPSPRQLISEEILETRAKAAGLNPGFTFKSFVVGTNSQFAHAACRAVATKRGLSYNPLYIHGSSGLGKTHLTHAIGRNILHRSPDSRVVYLTCEKFINEFIESIRKGDVEKFRRRYRSSDVLLIDDIQFIAGKERSQEEFFHTFNTLLDGRNQIVITSDCPACEIKNLEPRLISRFECGLTVELQPPQLETRIAILKKKTLEWKVTVDPDVIEFLAEKIRTNVRRLEGALVRVATFASLSGESVSVEKASTILRDLLQEEASRQITIDAIQRAVAESFDIRLADMISRRRPASIAFPRQIAMFLSRSLTHNSLVEIGESFGGRDHGTVIHACKKVGREMGNQDGLKERIERIESQLRR